MRQFKTLSLFALGLLLLFVGINLAQENDEILDCSEGALQAEYEGLAAEYPIEGDNAASNAFALGAALQDLALDCNYQADFPQVEAQIERTLRLAPLSMIIAASSIGSDVDVAMQELETVNGDSFNGQLLFNGIELGLDGAELGCVGCHNGEAAPVVEGTWTRADEIRLLEAQFEDYDVTRYLVESILHPEAYIVPEYSLIQMPHNYGSRLDAQQLADLVAYLESQDQELE